MNATRWSGPERLRRPRVARPHGQHLCQYAAASAYLCRQSPRRLTGYINYSKHHSLELWAHLEEMPVARDAPLETGVRQEGPIFSRSFRHGGRQARISAWHARFRLISSPAVVAAFDLSRFRRLGTWAAPPATSRRGLACITRRCARRFSICQALCRWRAEQVQPPRRLPAVSTCSPAISFQDPLPEADLYALGRIVHALERGQDRCTASQDSRTLASRRRRARRGETA